MIESQKKEFEDLLLISCFLENNENMARNNNKK